MAYILILLIFKLFGCLLDIRNLLHQDFISPFLWESQTGTCKRVNHAYTMKKSQCTAIYEIIVPHQPANLQLCTQSSEKSVYLTLMHLVEYQLINMAILQSTCKYTNERKCETDLWKHQNVGTWPQDSHS